MTSDNDRVDLNIFAVALLEAAQRTMKRAMDGLPDEQLYFRPSVDTNSIGWLAWHLTRWKDRFAARAVGEEQVWVAQGWAESFSMEPERNGMGDTTEQVESFRPSHDLLYGYIDSAHASVVERVGCITPERFLEPVDYASDTPERPVWQSLAGTVSDFCQHTGQIAYLRGLITGMGWR